MACKKWIYTDNWCYQLLHHMVWDLVIRIHLTPLYRLYSVLGSWAGCVQCLDCTVHYSTQQTMTSAGLGWGSAAQCTAVRVVTSDRLHSLVSCTHQHLHSHNCGLTNSNKIPLLYNSDCYNSSKILQVKFQV